MSRVSKQVLVMRKEFIVDGKKITPRKGKYIAQGAHAAMAALLNEMSEESSSKGSTFTLKTKAGSAIHEWITGRFTKITTCVNTLEELMVVYNQAKEKGLPCALITDAGNTEFNGEPTITCCAIGPAWDNEIDPITGGLNLF